MMTQLTSPVPKSSKIDIDSYFFSADIRLGGGAANKRQTSGVDGLKDAQNRSSCRLEFFLEDGNSTPLTGVQL
jgi:hypothetical protein